MWGGRIHCPNCGYEGKARLKDARPGPAMAAFLWLLLASYLVFPPIFLVGFVGRALIFVGCLLVLWFILDPVHEICPVCKYANPAPLGRWRKQTGG